MKRETYLNTILAAGLAIATVAFAEGSLDLWDDTADTPHVYVDRVFGDDFEPLKIEPIFLPGGSDSEDRYELRIQVGSTSEKRYVSTVDVEAELPSTSSVYEASDDWEALGDSLGDLEVTQGNREAILGDLLGTEVDAKAIPIQ